MVNFKYLKKISVLLLVMLLFFTSECGRHDAKVYNDLGKYKKFIVKGNISNGTGKKLYLQEITPNIININDSITLESDGKFELTAKTNYPGLYMLRTEAGPFFIICVKGGEKIEVIADYNDFHSYNLSGSEESEQIRLLLQKTAEALNQIDLLSKLSQDSIYSPNYASIKSRITTGFDSIMNDLRVYSIEFIRKNQTSLVSLVALKNQIGPQTQVLRPDMDKDLFLYVDSVLTSVYPKSELVLSLHDELNSFLAQSDANQTSKSIIIIGQLAPEIALPSPSGQIIKLSSLRGKIVLLDIWAAWCPPCREENPNLVLIYQKYHSKGFEIYQVSLDRTKDDWVKGIQEDGLNWLHVSDLKYWNSSIVSLYGIQGIPANFLLDKEGKVIASNLRGSALSEKLAEIFN